MPILGSKGGGSAGGYGLAGASVPQYINATGGPITEDGDYRIHTFTGPGTFQVKSAKEPTYANVDYLIVAGGGGTYVGGGGGAGGFRESYNPSTSGPYTASPLASPTSLPVSKQSYPITVGAGGNDVDSGTETNGSPSVFSSITSAGGGAGGRGFPVSPTPGGSGGSGGGVGRDGSGIPGGAGNTPPTSPSQGNPGGTSSAPQYSGSGGGGGAASPGGNGGGGSSGGIEFGGSGGPGHGTQINPSPSVGTPGPSAPLRYYAGGGSGYFLGFPPPPPAGYGGGGQFIYPSTANPGTANTGGGGSGGSATGGSGIVIIRYKFK